MDYYSGPNRYVCTALEEMREKLKLLDVNNIDKYKSVMAMCIEEVQTLVNIMEAALDDWKSLNKMKDERRKLKKEIKKLKSKQEELKSDNT